MSRVDYLCPFQAIQRNGLTNSNGYQQDVRIPHLVSSQPQMRGDYQVSRVTMVRPNCQSTICLEPPPVSGPVFI